MRHLWAALAALAMIVVTAGSVQADEGLHHFSRPDVAALGFPFSEAVRHGDTLYLSGVIGTQAGKAEVVPGGIGPETEATMEHIRAVLAAHGLGFGNLVKCTAFLADMAEWPQFNDVYACYFENGVFPARSAFGVSGLALGARLELECVAAFDDAS